MSKMFRGIIEVRRVSGVRWRSTFSVAGGLQRLLKGLLRTKPSPVGERNHPDVA